MPDIDSLERYFDILLDKNNQHDANHAYADDCKRHLLYDELKRDFHQLGENLTNISGALDPNYAEYVSIIDELSKSFEQMSGVSYRDLDFCVRSIAVERLIYRQSQAGQMTPQMLGYMVEALMALFFDHTEEVLAATKKTLQELKDQKDKRLLSAKKDEELKAMIQHTLTIYEEVEEDLIKAKHGLIAKDKKMLQVLRSVRLGLGKNLLNMAVQRSQADPKVKQSYIDRAKKRLKDKNQRGR